MVDATMDALAWVRKQVAQADTDLLREIVKVFVERVMSEERRRDERRRSAPRHEGPRIA